MSKRTLISEAEIVEPGDLDAIGLNAFEGDENILGGTIGYPLHWADFTMETPSAQVVRINQGRLFIDKEMYDLDASEDIDLQVHVPVVALDQRYVAIIVRGVEETVNAERFFETDVDTGATAPLQTPKTFQRTCEFVVQQGLSSPTPIKPIVADTNCTLCFVLLGAAGIISVESANDDRVKTLYEVEGRVTVLEAQMIVAYARTQTLQTDLANLQGRLKDFARRDVTRQLQEDMARVRRMLNLPDTARAYFYDPGLVKSQWSLGHANWDARVAEGIRFPYATTGQDSDPYVSWWLGVILLLAGLIGRLFQQTNSAWREWARMAAVILIAVAMAFVLASKVNAATFDETDTLDIAVPFIAKEEGKRNKAYQDIVGVWTICFGSTRGVRAGMVMSDAQCLQLLRDEVAEYRHGLHRYFSQATKAARLTPSRDAAYTSTAFNCGIGAIGKSTATRRLNSGDIVGGCHALTWWNKAGGRVIRGLANRREREKALCMQGV